MSEQLHVLLVEDNPGDAVLMTELLMMDAPGEFHVEQAARLSEAIEKVRQDRFDVILLDLQLPDTAGLGTVRSMRQAADVPIVVLTGRHDEQMSLAAIQEGAQDYVEKDLASGAFLSRVLRYAVERDRNIRRLRESESIRLHILDAVPQMVYWKDVNSVYLGCNQPFALAVGLSSPEEIVGKTDYDLPWSKEEAELYRADDRYVITHNAPKMHVEKRGRRADGTQIWADAAKVPLRDERGNVYGVLGVYEDITDRKQAEAVRAKLETQLFQSQKMEAVGRLAGGVAHDFNNMLGVMLGNAELAMMKLNPSDLVYRRLSEIQAAGKRSAELTRQLLAFARKQTISPKVLNLNETIESMLTMLRRLIGENIQLVWKPGQGLWPVKMDSVQIDQILANLAVNARDAIAHAGQVTVETQNVTIGELDAHACANGRPGSYVMLVVGDDGAGMDRDTVHKLFEPFFTTKGVGKGTGLGLATVYGIVNQNSGFINVYSEPGKGSTFKIYLPRYEGAESPPQEQTHEQAATGTETVLLVEDEASLLDLARMMLEQLGYKVLAANGPSQAIQIAAEHAGPIHLLMTDVVMPEMSGQDLWRRFHAERPGLRCVFMSGYTADIITNHGVLEDGVHFLEKPFAIQTLAVKLREALAGAQGTHE